jgi:CRP-like cAMP-binding protein
MKSKLDMLKTVSIFEHTPNQILEMIALLLEETEIKAGETLFEKGESGDSLYMIVKGKVRVHDEGRTLNYLGAGDVFGEMALLDPQPRSASVVAEQDTRLLHLDQKHFIQLLIKRGEVGLGIMRVLTAHLRARERDLAEALVQAEDLEQAWVAQRLAAFL